MLHYWIIMSVVLSIRKYSRKIQNIKKYFVDKYIYKVNYVNTLDK